MAKEIGITVRKEENFSEWYAQVVLKSGIADYFAVKGTIALKPYGYAIWEMVKKRFDLMLRRTGHRNVYFPTLIPEKLLAKEAEHFKGFVPEVFWVTRAGDRELGEELALRPTSETIVYALYSKWIKSWRDLPVLYNMWNSVFRAEIKATKPLVRNSEFLWQEGHTVHESEEDAEREVRRILRLYKRLAEEYLAIPVLEGRKSEREKFKGAVYTMTLEAMMPDGKAIQVATSHNLGQNFSIPFEVRFLGRDGKEHYAWTTSWGFSWRMIGAMIMIHGDDKGLKLPPRIAPIQCIIVPISYSKREREEVLKKARKVLRMLRKARLRAELDEREEYTPGWKFNDWELKGVPLRIEVGPRDVREGCVVMVRRDTGRKEKVPDGEVVGRAKELLSDIQREMLRRAREMLRRMTRSADSYEEFKGLIKEGGFVKAGWCGSEECEVKIKEETGADIRLLTDEKAKTCVYCGRPAKALAYFARAY